jgi:plasmid stabilization system protein ParE
MRLRFTRRAIGDLFEMAAYLKDFSPGSSEEVGNSILATAAMLCEFPKAGRIARHGTRRIVNRRYGYLIYYRVDDALDEIVVLAVRHPARRRPQP